MIDDLHMFEGVDRKRLLGILSAMNAVRMALIGDLCLDAYWKADMTLSELSRETPHFPLPIVEERYSPGAGGNAAVNIAALEPGSFTLIGAVGCDWRGEVLLQELSARGIDRTSIIRHKGIVTNAYIKPFRRGTADLEYEDPRLDFSNRISQPPDLENDIVEELSKAACSIDVLCVNDQFTHGCITDVVREEIVKLAKNGLKVVVDSRCRIGRYGSCILKPNELEGAAAAGLADPGKRVDLQASVHIITALARKTGSDICMTLGPQGCLLSKSRVLTHVPGIPLEPPLDICGAGDTFMAALSCALAAGADFPEAAAVANLAACVTIKKLNQTGTASRREILSLFDAREPGT